MDAQILAAKSLFEAFLITASRDPHAIAWVAANPKETRPRWTWAELRDGVFQAAAHLAQRGVKKGDRVANLGRNSAQWALLDLACSALGAIHAPIDIRYPTPWIERCIQDLEPSAVYSDHPAETVPSLPLSAISGSTMRTSQKSLENRAADVEANDGATILFTSGTTNYPRGVALSHRNLLSNGLAKLDAMPQSPTDFRLNLLPFSHSYARTCELTAWILAGGIMACAHGIQATLQQAPRLRPQLINAVPFFFEQVACSPALQDSLGGALRRLASGGAPIRESLRHRFEQDGVPIFQGYGLTEASPVVCSNRESSSGNPMLEGVGPPVRGVKVRVDADRRIWVAGDGVMLGYWRDPATSAEKMVDGWLDTGDLAAESNLGPEQVLHIEGRWDDLQILANGYKFSPRPLEQRLLSEIQAIEHCVLLGTGRQAVLLAVQTRDSTECVSSIDLLGRAREVLWDAPEFARPVALWRDTQVWSVANGCLHWKGMPNRRRIYERSQTVRSS